ncbi:MAG TPA: recombination protein NinG [Chitinophagaceae bacterium]|nr:recombination protein NinG [Chitinophagaceae bacterium]
MKRKQYASKTNQNNKVRSLGNKQVQEGNYDAASRQALKYDLDYCFRRIVKMTAADNDDGLVSCYTCTNIAHWSMPFMQCGHFIKRGETQLRWDFRNARVQCKTCNENLEGNLKIYAERLNEEYPGLPDQLREIAQEPYSYGISELKQLLIDLRAKLRIVEANHIK